MPHSVDTTLLEQLWAIEQQKIAFDTNTKAILDRCRAEHTATTKGNTVTAVIVPSGEDIEMSDAPAVALPSPQANGPCDTGTGWFLCRPCFNSILALVHKTYAELPESSGPGTPGASKVPLWCAQDDSFMAELDAVLDDVRALRAPLHHVDEYLTTKKRKWLHSQLRDAAALQAIGTSSTTGGKDKDLERLLADPEPNLSRLLGTVAESAAETGNGKDKERILNDAKAAVKKLVQQAREPSAHSGLNSEQGVVYRDSLFPSGVPNLPAARAIEKKMLEGQVGLDEGLVAMLRDIVGGDDEATRAAKIEKHQKRLAEMRRAKAAHEAEKAKKMKPTEVPYFLKEDATCATCSKACDPQQSQFCKVCFLEIDFCLPQNQTVWCSTACLKKSYANHFAERHPCKAGDRCSRIRSESDSIARQEPRYCFCKECILVFSKSTIYCTDRCAGRDFQSHREHVHLHERRLRHDFRDDRNELSYSSYEELDYTAADIAKHVLSIEEAVASCQNKHPDWTMTETKVQITLP